MMTLNDVELLEDFFFMVEVSGFEVTDAVITVKVTPATPFVMAVWNAVDVSVALSEEAKLDAEGWLTWAREATTVKETAQM